MSRSVVNYDEQCVGIGSQTKDYFVVIIVVFNENAFESIRLSLTETTRTYQIEVANLVQIHGELDLHELLTWILPQSVNIHAHLADIQRLGTPRERNVAEKGSTHEQMNVSRQQIEQREDNRRDVVVRSD